MRVAHDEAAVVDVRADALVRKDDEHDGRAVERIAAAAHDGRVSCGRGGRAGARFVTRPTMIGLCLPMPVAA